MQITAVYTAQLRQHTGCAEEVLDLPDQATLADAFAAISTAHPGSAPFLRRPAAVVFVDGEQAEDDAVCLRPQGEILFLAPISGG